MTEVTPDAPGQARPCGEAAGSTVGLWTEDTAPGAFMAWPGALVPTMTERAPLPPLTKGGSYASNPCLVIFGPGPDGARCGTCVHLQAHKQSATWYKCAQRGTPTHGPKTDHRVRWPACGRYEARREDGGEVHDGD